MRAVLGASLFFLSCGLAWAQAGYTIREVEMKREPFDDAATVAKLAEKTPIEITRRQGAWMEVKSGQAAGWIRMLSVRMGAAGEARSGSSGLGALFNIGRTGSSGATVTTGVRGLDKEEIRNAKPNLAELQKMQGYAASRQDAERFAAGEPRLASQRVEYLRPPKAPAAQPHDPFQQGGTQ